LTTDVERRLVPLITSTPGNEFQRLIFSVPFSEANASGMECFGDGVSKKVRLSSFRKPSELRLAERIKLDDDGRSERPFLKS